VEFARYSLELWQDGKNNKLRKIAQTLQSASRIDEVAGKVVDSFIKVMYEDWAENGANFDEFLALLNIGNQSQKSALVHD